MDPDFYWAHRQLGMALELKGSPNEAIVEYQRAAELNDDPRVLAFVGHAMASTGKQNEAREMLAKLTEDRKDALHLRLQFRGDPSRAGRERSGAGLARKGCSRANRF